MRENLYLFNDSIIKRKNNTIWCEKNLNDKPDDGGYTFKMVKDYLLDRELLFPSGEKRCIPIEHLNSIFSFGIIHLNSDLLFFLSKHNIPMHIFNVYGNYQGSYFPPKESSAGDILIEQTLCYKDNERRMSFAREMVLGAAHNILMNLKNSILKGADVHDKVCIIEDITRNVKKAESVQELLGYEGNIKRNYYDCWDRIITQPIDFGGRNRKPPLDPINVMISYGNAILYSMCLNKIYHTRLYPEIGFIHQPGDYKYPLSYDIADIFKPLTVDRVIFKMFNKMMLTEEDFNYTDDYCVIREKAKKLFVKQLDEKMHTTLKTREFNKEMSYRRLIRGECQKIIENIYYNTDSYSSYKSKW